MLLRKRVFKVLCSTLRRVTVFILATGALGILLVQLYLPEHESENKIWRFPHVGVKDRTKADPVDHTAGSVLNRTEFTKKYRLGPQTLNGSTLLFREFLLYGSLNNLEDFPELRGILSLFADDRSSIPGALRRYASVTCRAATGSEQADTVIGLTVSTKKAEFASKEAVVFGMMPKMFANNFDDLLNTEPSFNQLWVYFSLESPFRAMKWVKDLRLAKLKYHKLMSYNLEADIPFPFGFTDIRQNGDHGRIFTELNFAKGKTKLIAWMASNCEEIFWPRNEFVERVRELVPVDTYGRCGAVDCLPRSAKQCTELLTRYKFYLALANSECRDYITEKFWSTALGHDIVPVVGGAPREDFERVAPPGSFVHIGDYKTIKDLVNYLLSVDGDDALYNKHFAWKQTRRIVDQFPPRPELFCKILPHLGKELPTVRLLQDSPWFKTCRHSVNISSSVRVRARLLDNNFDTWSPWRLN